MRIVSSQRVESGKLLLWGHVIAFILVLLMASQFPQWPMLCVGFVVAYMVPVLVCRFLMSGWSYRLAWVMLVSALILSFGVTQNLSTYISGEATLQEPYLGQDVYSDASRDYYAALDIYSGREVPALNIGWPMALHFFYSCREGVLSMRSVKMYVAIYLSLLLIALIVSYCFLKCN